ncbi:MAG: methylmalonyl Co-A mutase-associated GTPase MeaB [Desulfobacteraceae bacterium]|nr:methylmalonyl Co-A mutase-associated GTPase MeaB [Desulfobacteraceae bacterium]MBU4053288.1 methylmalonyl Co-A mutase-associated GTPase MeaB [Pseudomonadota bacterium]
MVNPLDATDVILKILAGEVRAASRLIRNLEDKLPGAKASVMALFPHTGRARIVGLTGAPGAGKSTLVDRMISVSRKQSKTVGVLAVDPTSPFTGGAILGDRVRMKSHGEDPDVFVRSLATRGALGGLSAAVGDAVHVMDAMGKDLILVETVGAGQQEVDIINHSHTVILVLTPGMGDEIQAIKAGVMEIADIFVINKADREGAGRLENELTSMLNMVSEFPGHWRPPIIKIGNAGDEEAFARGVENLAGAAEQHFQMLLNTKLMDERMQRKAKMELREALHHILLDPVLNDLAESGEMERIAIRIMKKETDPHRASREITRKYLDNIQASLRS